MIFWHKVFSIPSLHPIGQIVEERRDIIKERFSQRRFILFLHCRHPVAGEKSFAGSWTGQSPHWQVAAHWLSRVRLGKGLGRRQPRRRSDGRRCFDVPATRAVRPPRVIGDRCLTFIHATRHALPPAGYIAYVSLATSKMTWDNLTWWMWPIWAMLEIWLFATYVFCSTNRTNEMVIEVLSSY